MTTGATARMQCDSYSRSGPAVELRFGGDGWAFIGSKRAAQLPIRTRLPLASRGVVSLG
jgi:hypothetical protein